ncbi:MAG TPA: helix-turn-helix domain-containing protein, partial [Clostridia bacterium]|nr:helix-turn-helix domain-containing protein [Clostridia bacterium]
ALSAPALRLLGWTFLALLLSFILSAVLLYATSLRVTRPIRNLIRLLDGSQVQDKAEPFSELTAIEASWRALYRQNLAYAGEVSDQRDMRRRNAMIALLLGQPCDQEMIDAAQERFEGCASHQVAVVDLAGADASRWEAALAPWKDAAVCMVLSLSPVYLALLIGWRTDAPEANELEARLAEQARTTGCILGLGLPRNLLTQLHDSYREATAMLGHAKQEGKPFLSYRAVSAQDGVRRGYRKYDEMTRRMSERIAERDVPAAKELVRQFFSHLDLDNALRPSDRKMLELQMANTLWLSASDSLREGLAPDAYEIMYLRSDGAAIQDWAMEILELLSKEAASASAAGLVGQRILEYVGGAYRKPLGLEETAARFHMGTTTFCGLFKEISGSTFADHLTRLRLDEACRLLRETEDKVLDVAEQSGFGSQQNMLRAFRKLLGTTPVKYRSLHRDQ